jgi:hypothetical protein
MTALRPWPAAPPRPGSPPCGGAGSGAAAASAARASSACAAHSAERAARYAAWPLREAAAVSGYGCAGTAPSESRYPTPRVLWIRGGAPARASFRRSRQACASTVRAFPLDLKPHTPRSSSHFVNTRGDWAARWASRSNSSRLTRSLGRHGAPCERRGRPPARPPRAAPAAAIPGHGGYTRARAREAQG